MSYRQPLRHSSTAMPPQLEAQVAVDAHNTAMEKGYHLRWSRLTKTVDIPDSSGGITGRATIGQQGSAANKVKTKTILHSCSGSATPGQVLACMGPSGAGKTTLLNVLSGRASFQEGYLSVNGKELSAAGLKRLSRRVAYVRQADIFFEHLTVRDQLTYTALLRAQETSSVDKIIKTLRLAKVADSPIQLLSGGEKKRVNIGTELLTDPSVLLLDEPTSGLDSTSAVSLLNLVRDLAQQNGKTVITTIHQPSSAVFRSFDQLILLSEGMVVYFGTPVASLQYLRDMNLACPDGYNGSDYWMDLLVITEDEQGQDQEEGTRKLPRIQLQEAWDGDAVAAENDKALTQAADAESIGKDGSKYSTDWMTQYFVLTHRALKNSRSAIFTSLNLLKSVAIGAVAGMAWFQLDYTERHVDDIRGYYFFTMTFWVFDSMFGALMSFPAENAVIVRERASGSYRLSAYFLAKTTSDAPVRLVLPLIYMIISYWMIGISTSFVTFVASIGCALLSVVAGEAFGLLVGAAIEDLQKAITFMTVSMLFLMLLGGFFVENVPDFLQWAKFLSPFKYAFDSSLQLIFDHAVPCDGSGVLESLCSGNTNCVTVDEVRDFIGIQGSLGFNVGLLVVLCFIPRYAAYLFLRHKKAPER